MPGWSLNRRLEVDATLLRLMCTDFPENSSNSHIASL